jgi:hypothetical protein
MTRIVPHAPRAGSADPAREHALSTATNALQEIPHVAAGTVADALSTSSTASSSDLYDARAGSTAPLNTVAQHRPRGPVALQAKLLSTQGPVPRLEVLASKLQDADSVRAAAPFIERAMALFADVSDVSPSAVHAADYEAGSADDKARQVWRKLQEGTHDLSLPAIKAGKALAAARLTPGAGEPDVAAAALKAKGLHTGCPFSGGVPPAMGDKGILGDGLKSVARVFHLRELQRTFDNPSDFVKPHDKLLHTNGGAVMFVRVPASKADHGYTGLFADTEPAVGVARYSAGATNERFVSGLATKIFRDGEHSGNAVYIHGPGAYAPNEPKDPFSKPLLSAVDGPEDPVLKVLNFGFTLSSNPNVRPVDQMASHTARGERETAAKAPFLLEVESVDPALRFYDDAPRTPEQVASDAELPENDYRLKMQQKLQPGTILGEEWGRDEKTGARVHLATYVAVSGFVSSRASDEELHFRHSRGEESTFTRVVQGFVTAYDAAMDLFARNE